MNTSDYIESFNSALDDEIKFEREAGGKRYRLTDGDLVLLFLSVLIFYGLQLTGHN